MQKLYLGIILAFCFPMSFLFGQNPEDIKLSNTLFIENAMVKSKAGMAAKKSSILIVDGIIKAVGTNLSAPAEAEIIKGDSLFAYPAFIDAFSHTGIPKSDEKNNREKVNDPDNPGFARAGITPQLSVSESLKIDDSSVESMRKAGFAISHVALRGGMLPGRTSIIVLTNQDQPYIKKDVSLAASLASARGRVYPSTVIAVMAKYRDLVQRARSAQQHEQSYLSNSTGLTRPNYPTELQALYDAVDRKEKVFMIAEETLDISRVIKLNEELKFDIVLVEVKRAWPNINAIKQNNIPLLLSLDIPEEMKEEEKDSTDTTIDLKRNKLIDRRKEAIMAYQHQAKVIADQGVKFGFSLVDVKTKNIQKNLEIIQKSGLTEDQLLEAITTTPAQLLGIDKVAGSIEVGKMGNIILSDKTMFEEGRNIEYMIVEGQSFTFEKKKKKKKKGNDNSDSPDISGKWSVEVEIPGQTETGVLTFEKTDGEYSGNMLDSDGEVTQLEAIELDGSSLSFSMTADVNGQSFTMEVATEVDGETMEGTFTVGPLGSFPLTGSRTTKPKK